MDELFCCDDYPCGTDEIYTDTYTETWTDVQTAQIAEVVAVPENWGVALPTVTDSGVELGIDPTTGQPSAGVFGLDILADLRNAPDTGAQAPVEIFDPNVNMGEIGTRLDLPTSNIASDRPYVDPTFNTLTGTTDTQRWGQLTPNT